MLFFKGCDSTLEGMDGCLLLIGKGDLFSWRKRTVSLLSDFCLNGIHGSFLVFWDIFTFFKLVGESLIWGGNRVGVGKSYGLATYSIMLECRV